MIDLRQARAEPEAVRAALERKGAAALFDELLAADARWREVSARRDEVRAAQKKLGKPTPEQIEEAKRLKAELQQLDGELAKLEAERQVAWDGVPNPPDPSAPEGETEDDAVEVRRWGEPPDFSFEARDHLDLGPGIDMERGARVSGSRFAYR